MTEHKNVFDKYPYAVPCFFINFTRKIKRVFTSLIYRNEYAYSSFNVNLQEAVSSLCIQKLFYGFPEPPFLIHYFDCVS